MRNIWTLAAGIVLAIAAAPAWASTPPTDAAHDFTATFASEPLSDAALADVAGTALSTGPSLRSLSDDNATVALQQAGQISRVVMDNWWSQTGAALIDNNIALGQMASR